jgi:hypothetical protein
MPPVPKPARLPNVELGTPAPGPARTPAAAPVGGSVAPVTVAAGERSSRPDARAPRRDRRTRRRLLAVVVAVPLLGLAAVGVLTTGVRGWMGPGPSDAQAPPLAGGAPQPMAAAVVPGPPTPALQSSREPEAVLPDRSASAEPAGGPESSRELEIVVPTTTVVAAPPRRAPAAAAPRPDATKPAPDSEAGPVPPLSRSPLPLTPLFAPLDGSSELDAAATPPGSIDLDVRPKAAPRAPSTEEQTPPTRLEPGRWSTRGKLRVP